MITSCSTTLNTSSRLLSCCTIVTLGMRFPVATSPNRIGLQLSVRFVTLTSVIFALPAPAPPPPVVLTVCVAPNDQVSAENIPVPAEVVHVSPSTVTTIVDLLPRPCPFCAKAAVPNRIITANKPIFFIATFLPDSWFRDRPHRTNSRLQQIRLLKFAWE